MGMVCIVVATIHLFKWHISKPLGILYFCLYAVFVAEVSAKRSMHRHLRRHYTH